MGPVSLGGSCEREIFLHEGKSFYFKSGRQISRDREAALQPQSESIVTGSPRPKQRDTSTVIMPSTPKLLRYSSLR